MQDTPMEDERIEDFCLQRAHNVPVVQAFMDAELWDGSLSDGKNRVCAYRLSVEESVLARVAGIRMRMTQANRPPRAILRRIK